MKNHYTTLGISPSATAEQIKTAYTNAVISIHGFPDFALRFAELREAYETLSDPKTRKTYDAELGYDLINEQEANTDESGAYISSLISMIVGYYKRSPLKKTVDYILNPFLNPFRKLPTGYYRLFLACWFLIPFFVAGYTYILDFTSYKSISYYSSSNKATDVFVFLVCVYYPIARLVLWVWNGFKRND